MLNLARGIEDGCGVPPSRKRFRIRREQIFAGSTPTLRVCFFGLLFTNDSNFQLDDKRHGQPLVQIVSTAGAPHLTAVAIHVVPVGSEGTEVPEKYLIKNPRPEGGTETASALRRGCAGKREGVHALP